MRKISNMFLKLRSNLILLIINMFPLSINNIAETTKHLKEHYSKSSPSPSKNGEYFLIIALIILLVSVILWFVALFLLVKYWNQIPSLPKLLGIIGLIPQVPLGPIITIIVVLASKK